MYGNKLFAAIVVVILLFVGNLFYYETQQLEGPYLLQHYYDVKVSPDGYARFELLYVTNKEEDKIWQISVPGTELARVEYETIQQDLPHVYIKRASIEVYGQNLAEELLVTDVEILFSGETLHQIYSIGEIKIQPSTFVDREPVVGTLASGSSSDQTSFAIFHMKEPLQLVEINHPFPSRLKDYFQLYVDFDTQGLTEFKEDNLLLKNDPEYIHERLRMQGEEIANVQFPMYFEANDVLKVNHAFHFSKSDQIRNSVFKFEIQLLFESNQGEEVRAKAFANYLPYFTNREIMDLVKKAGGQGE